MAEFFKTSVVWVVDFTFDGRPRRWFRAFGPDVDVRRAVETVLHDLHGDRARLVQLRRASEDEETAYLRGDEPANPLCPTGR